MLLKSKSMESYGLLDAVSSGELFHNIVVTACVLTSSITGLAHRLRQRRTVPSHPQAFSVSLAHGLVDVDKETAYPAPVYPSRRLSSSSGYSIAWLSVSFPTKFMPLELVLTLNTSAGGFCSPAIDDLEVGKPPSPCACHPRRRDVAIVVHVHTPSG